MRSCELPERYVGGKDGRLAGSAIACRQRGFIGVVYAVSRLSGMVPILWPARDNAADSTVLVVISLSLFGLRGKSVSMPFVLPTCGSLPDWPTERLLVKILSFVLPPRADDVRELDWGRHNSQLHALVNSLRITS